MMSVRWLASRVAQRGPAFEANRPVEAPDTEKGSEISPGLRQVPDEPE